MSPELQSKNYNEALKIFLFGKLKVTFDQNILVDFKHQLFKKNIVCNSFNF